MEHNFAWGNLLQGDMSRHALQPTGTTDDS